MGCLFCKKKKHYIEIDKTENNEKNNLIQKKNETIYKEIQQELHFLNIELIDYKTLIYNEDEKSKKGSGKDGTVYKGKWKDLGIAIKKLKTQWSSKKFDIYIFLSNLQKTAKMQTMPNIVNKLYGVALNPLTTDIYIVMSLAKYSLYDVIKKP